MLGSLELLTMFILFAFVSSIPLRSVKCKPKPSLSGLFDRPKYRKRKIIERMFGWLEENCRIVTRFDKLAKSYAAMVSLACSMRCVRHL